MQKIQLKSMTAYGSSSAAIGNMLIKIEMNAINGKFADIKFRMPAHWQEKENHWRSLLAKKIERGTVHISISTSIINGIAQKPKALINQTVFNSYCSQIRTLASQQNLDPSFLLPFIVNLPGVLLGEKEELIENIDEMLENCLENCYKTFDKNRIAEGDAIAMALIAHIKSIVSKIEDAKTLIEMRNLHLKTKLNQMAKKWEDDVKFNAERLELEILYYLEKLDVTEEINRLSQHCTYFIATLAEQAAGKKLGFICQEMGREITTLGNKANYFELQKTSVEMKEELEKIKEQVLNIL